MLKDCMEWFGPDSVYVEVQRNYLQGDAELTRASVRLALDLGAPIVASNDVHYHNPDRYRLQHALVAARLNTTMERALPHIKPNQPPLTSSRQTQMTKVFDDLPRRPFTNTVKIAEQCEFDLATGLGYTLPGARAVPIGLHPRQLPETPLLRGRHCGAMGP